MKFKNVLIISLLTTLLSSCVVMSFYPIYTNNTVIKDNRIIGKWECQNNDGVWEITFPDTLKTGKYSDIKNKNKNTYLLKFYLGAKPEIYEEYQLHLVKIGKNIFADFYPLDMNTELAFERNLFPVHSFAKIKIGDELDLFWPDPDWVENLITKNKIRIRHEKNDEGNFLLTAKPEELQKFLAKYGNDTKFYGDHSKRNYKRLN